MITREDLRTLATATPGDAVLSVYARTDPRDPANTAATPAWEIALRNGLSAVAHRLEAREDRHARLRFRELRPAVEERVLALEPHERARSIAWFFGEEGDTIGTYALQLPLRGDAVVRDARPYVSPLVDVVDRGAPTGVVLAGRERVRLVHLEQGEASEPDDPAFELELGDWRPYGGTAGGSPSRGLRTTAHQERYDARVDEQRDRLYARAGEATAGRLEALGWERVALLAERGVASAFGAALPAAIVDRLVVDAEANVDRDDPATIADTVEPWLEDAWRESVVDLADRARTHALAGGPGAIGAKETLWALDEGRVEHLILDPDADFTEVAAMTPPGIAGPPELLGERAVEAAVATGAEVSTVPVATAPALEESGGMVALLRY
jgi:Bacterial archaeo-eukaryotic release factor family 10